MELPGRKISTYNYNGPSMKPILKPGDGIIIAEDIPFEALRKGDVICFDSSEKPINVVHRIVAITPQGLITRGDNNSDKDSSYVLPKQNPQFVKGLRRGDKTIKIHGGIFGMLIHRKSLLRRFLLPYTKSPLKRVLDLIADSGIFYKLKLFDKKITISKFKRFGNDYHVLLYRNCTIGQQHKDGSWNIRTPWNFFIDARKLGDREKETQVRNEEIPPQSSPAGRE